MIGVETAGILKCQIHPMQIGGSRRTLKLASGRRSGDLPTVLKMSYRHLTERCCQISDLSDRIVVVRRGADDVWKFSPCRIERRTRRW